jgi:hypothetical protein
MAEQNQQSSTELCLPFGLNPEKTGSTLKFNHLYKQVTDAQEMVTLLHVLSQRGWDLRLG